MHDDVRRLVEHAYAGAIPDNEDQRFVWEIVEAGFPIKLKQMRERGGRATAKLNKNKAAKRQTLLVNLISLLPR